MEEQLAEQLSPRRFQTSLLGLFSVIAMVLAVVGTFGVMHYSVAQRTHEIGIRAALGAQPQDETGSLGARRIHRETLLSETSKPSLRVGTLRFLASPRPGVPSTLQERDAFCLCCLAQIAIEGT